MAATLNSVPQKYVARFSLIMETRTQISHTSINIYHRKYPANYDKNTSGAGGRL